MPSVRAAACTRPSTSRAGTRWMVSASATFSKAVSVSSRFASWNTKPNSSRRNFASSAPERPVTSRPPTEIRPAVGASMVARQFRSVDLPEPDGPMIPTNSPASTAKLTWSSARVTLPPAWRRPPAP